MREKNTKQRLAIMLDRDKEVMSEASRIAATRDFRHVAEEYFETDGDVSIDVVPERGGSRVTVCFRARRVKNFTTLK